MKRTTIYDVGGKDALFSPDDWDKLAASLPGFAGGFYYASGVPDEYRCSSKAACGRPQTFGVWRADLKTLVAAEKNALSWYFRGVMAAYRIKCVEGTSK